MSMEKQFRGGRLARREFLAAGAWVGGMTATGLRAQVEAPAVRANPARWKAAILGHTGAGNFGHDLDVAFRHRLDVEVVAVSDPDVGGRAKAAERSGALRQYADWRELLEKEKPGLVCVAPRWTNQRHDMVLEALGVGAHVYTEKPFTTTLEEADDLLERAGRKGLRIAVAHQQRLAPSILALRRAIEEGMIGRVVRLTAWGKQDTRAGGEDMLVLGVHLFDLIRCLGGDPVWCSARVMEDGREITRRDARRVVEQIGPVAGNQIHAQFALPSGAMAEFVSDASLREQTGMWGIEVVGSRGRVRILSEIYPAIHVWEPGVWSAAGRTDGWKRWSGDPGVGLSEVERGFGPANARVVDDWLAAVDGNREPVCSGRAAMKALEMVMAVYRAQFDGGRVTLPLSDRRHPLM